MATTGGLVRRKSIVGSNSQIPSTNSFNNRYNNFIKEIC